MKLILAAFALLVIASTNSRKGAEADSNYGDVRKNTQAHQKLTHADVADEPEDDDVFYFFSLHDYDKDGKLDGHELGLAFQGYEFYNGTTFEESLDTKDLEFMIDHALHEDDSDNDGKISWEEYLESQKYHHKLE